MNARWQRSSENRDGSSPARSCPAPRHSPGPRPGAVLRAPVSPAVMLLAVLALVLSRPGDAGGPHSRRPHPTRRPAAHALEIVELPGAQALRPEVVFAHVVSPVAPVVTAQRDHDASHRGPGPRHVAVTAVLGCGVEASVRFSVLDAFG